MTELVTATVSGEVPDAIGWRNGGRVTILVECKVTRSDFLADMRKPFRVTPAKGVGDWRFYLSPPGIIEPDDLPEGWGLLHVAGRKICAVKGLPIGNCSWGETPFVGAKEEETVMLVSALRRLNVRGLLHHIYERLEPQRTAASASEAVPDGTSEISSA